MSEAQGYTAQSASVHWCTPLKIRNFLADLWPHGVDLDPCWNEHRDCALLYFGADEEAFAKACHRHSLGVVAW